VTSLVGNRGVIVNASHFYSSGVRCSTFMSSNLCCQKPFNLEGVDFNIDSRCKVILDLLKSELLLENIK